MPTDPSHRRAIPYIRSAAAILSRGGKANQADLQRALQSIRDAMSILLDTPRNQGRQELLADCFYMGAKTHLDLANVDQAFVWFDTAVKLYQEANAQSEGLAACLHDLAVTWYETTRRAEPALEYADRAQKLFVRNKHEYARIGKFIDFLRRLDGTLTAEDLPALRDDLRAARGPEERVEAAIALVNGLLNSPTDPERVRELHDTLRTAYSDARRVKSEHGIDALVLILQTTHVMRQSGIPIPTWMLAATDETLADAIRTGRRDQQSDLLAARATQLWAANDQTGALQTALAALASHDEHSLQTETTFSRYYANQENESTRQYALELAVAFNDITLVAELIESSRLQVEPVPNTEGPGGMRGNNRIAGLRPVAVWGNSRLAQHYTQGIAGVPVSLEHALMAVGGPGLCWWAAWLGKGRTYWVLLLDGRWSCGEIRLTDPAVQRLMDRALNAVPGRATTDEVLEGPWSRSADEEEAFATDLGDVLLPGPLKEHMAKWSPSDAPISLVLSGSLFTMLPVGLLAVRSRHSTTRRRLVETAILREAPPAILTQAVMNRPVAECSIHPLLVACVDPTGDLPHGLVPGDARTIVSGRTCAGCRPATIDNLRAALNETPPGHPGLFYYSGHVATGGPVMGSHDAMELAGGAVLSAQDIFDNAGSEKGPWFPTRVLLSACSSGAEGTGAGEWLGLTAAILWAGARHVVSTKWTIWDTHFVAEFDRRLVRTLQQTNDVAAALRACQLLALDDWRASDHDFHHRPDRETVMITAFPLMWSAYGCVGLID
jgi:hypothetical protein